VKYLLLLPACLLLSCGKTASGPDPAGTEALKIVIVDGQSRTPPAYAVHLTPPGGKTLSACRDESASSQGAITFLPDGCKVATSADSLDIVVKAAGFHPARIAYSRRASPGGAPRFELSPLDAFTTTVDYSTGFPAEGGSDLFISMAVKGSGETGTTYTVKFFIDGINGAPKVYFQNTQRHPLHYLFVRDVLGRPLTLGEFEARTYQGADRSGMAGSLVWRKGFSSPAGSQGGSDSERIDAPMTVEFFPSDDLSPSQALAACQLLEERILFPGPCGRENRVHYLPPASGHESALAGRKAEFASAGMRWMTRAALFGGTSRQLLNAGEAYGTLRLLSPEGLITAPVSFRDILLLPRLPNAMPLVGGTITEELQTPLSHVNVAARGRRTPNLALPGASARPEIAALIDSLVHFKVTSDTFFLEKAGLAEAERFWEGIHPKAPEIPPADLESSSLEPFSRLAFADRARIGVKAANLAELSKLIPGHAPDGFAVPFARYEEFLANGKLTAEVCAAASADCAQEGRGADICSAAAAYREPFCGENAPLRAFVDSLLDNPRFQADSRFREASLDGLRFSMRHIPVEPGFARALDAFSDSLFHGKRIRLRSSTNAEDLEDFSGAGLYSSTGADAGGLEAPSAEIRKVWASVWNWQAFEERSFRRIDHRKVHMGVAVHPAFTAEAANGVVVTRNLADPALDGIYVNVQPGETSVTNPVDGALPEIFTIVEGAVAGGTVIRQRYSSLSPEMPILSDGEIARLGEIASEAHNRFALLYGKDPRDPAFALEMEFKIDLPGRSVFIKQARPFAR
jgi:pyruvate,water dikinase